MIIAHTLISYGVLGPSVVLTYLVFTTTVHFMVENTDAACPTQCFDINP